MSSIVLLFSFHVGRDVLVVHPYAIDIPVVWLELSNQQVLHRSADMMAQSITRSTITRSTVAQLDLVESSSYMVSLRPVVSTQLLLEVVDVVGLNHKSQHNNR